MPINFPDNPSADDTYTVNGRTYKWSGTKWRRHRVAIASSVPSLTTTNDFTAGGTLHVDSVNESVGIGTSSPNASEALTVGGDTSVAGDLTVSGDIVADTVSSSAGDLAALVRAAMPIGSLTAYAGSSSPDASWLMCDGSAISRTTYASLFALIGTTYGSGNGSTTFNVPDLRGKVPVGLDSSDTDFDALGETGGAKTHTLSSSEIPSHSHSIDHNHASVTSDSGGNAHTHSIDPPNTTSSSAGSHGHSGTFGSSSHRHYVQAALGDYYYAASAGNAGWTVYGMSTYGVNWNGATHMTNRSETVNNASGYVSVSHGIYQTTGQTYTPNSTASVSSGGDHTHTTNIGAFTSGGASATSHTHSVDLPNFTGTSGSAGSGGAHNNVQPYIVFNWIIKAV